MFVTVNKHQRFKSLSVKRYLPGLNFRPATLKSRVLVIWKLLTISSNCGLRCFQMCGDRGIVCKRSIALCNFSTEMKSEVMSV